MGKGQRPPLHKLRRYWSLFVQSPLDPDRLRPGNHKREVLGWLRRSNPDRNLRCRIAPEWNMSIRWGQGAPTNHRQGDVPRRTNHRMGTSAQEDAPMTLRDQRGQALILALAFLMF